MDFESRDLSFLAGNPSSRFDKLFMRSSIKAIARIAREREWSAEDLRDYVEDHSGYRHYGFPDEASFDEFVSTMCNEFEIEPGQDGLPREFYEHAGALVDFAYYTVRTSPRPQPVLALLGGICLVSCLIGRKIKSSLGAKGNIFVATFAKSAAGKNRVLEAFNEVATAAGCPEYILPGDMTSDSALADALSTQPAGLWPLDEFGKFLRVANDEKASGPLVLLISLIMRLFTSCGLRNFVPKKFADSDKDRVIDMPHLVIYATGTPESLRFLTAENNRDGFNSRFVFYGDDSSRPLHQSVEAVPIPEPLLNWMKVAANYRPHEGDVTWEPGEMRTIPVTPEAKLAWERFRRRCDVLADTYTEDEGASIYARAAERASSLALIFAASQVPIDRDFSIEKAHMDWAIALKLGDEIDAVKMAFGGMTTQIGLAVAGPLTEWTSWLKDQIPELTKWLKENQGVVVAVAKIAAGAAIAGAALTAFGVATTGVGLGMTQAVGAANGLMKGLKGLGSVAAGGGGLLAIAAIATAIGLAIARWASNTEEYNKQLAISKRLNTELEDIDRKRTQKSLDENRGKASLAQRKKDIDEKIRIAEKNVHGSGQGVQNAENNITAANGWGNWFLDNTVGSAELDSLRTDVKDAEDKRESDRQNLQSLLDERATIDAQLADQKKLQDAMKPSTIKWAGRVGGRVAGMAQNWGQGVFQSGVGLAEAAKEQAARIDEADIERRQGLFDEAKEIRESNKTPAQRRKERLAKIDELRTSGALGDQDAAMARAKIGLEAAQEKTAELDGRVQKRESLNLGISEDQKSLLAAQAGKMNAEDLTAKNTATAARTLDGVLNETRKLNQYLTQNGVALVEADG